MVQIEMPDGCTGRVQSMVLEIQRDGVRVGWIMTTDGECWTAQRIVERHPRSFLFDIVETKVTDVRAEAIAFASTPPSTPPVHPHGRNDPDTNDQLEE